METDHDEPPDQDTCFPVEYSLFETFYFMASTCSQRMITVEQEVDREHRRLKEQAADKAQTKTQAVDGNFMDGRFIPPGEGFSMPRQEDIDQSPRARLARLAISRLLFSAIALEGIINNYGFRKLPKVFDSLDKIPTAEKWHAFPQIAVGQTLEPEVMNSIGQVIRARNDLAHNKTKIVDYAKSGNKWDLEATAVRLPADRIVKQALMALKAIDDTVDTEWIMRRIASKWEAHW